MQKEVSITTGTIKRNMSKRRRIDFELKMPEAQRVILMGDFNQWNPKTHPMCKEANAVWPKTVKISLDVMNTVSGLMGVIRTILTTPRNARTISAPRTTSLRSCHKSFAAKPMLQSHRFWGYHRKLHLTGPLSLLRFHQILRPNRSPHPSMNCSPIHLIHRY